MSTEFKDLCLDVNDPQRMARFWAPVLGLAEPRGENLRLDDDVEEHAVWLNRVPEVKTVKHRVHLDVHVAGIHELLDAGARVLDDSHPWTVMADPEGGEFCAFVRSPEQLPRYRLYELGVDAQDPERIAGWWAARFGAEPQTEVDADHWWVEGTGRLPWAMVFAPVPEPKMIKNRVHWDIWGKTSDLLDAGARLLRSRDDEISWDVLADPEGNEFCVFARELQ